MRLKYIIPFALLAIAAQWTESSPLPDGGGNHHHPQEQQQHHHPQEHQQQHHQQPQQQYHHPPQSSYGGQRRKGALDKILEIPKGIAIGYRRLKGGLIAIGGGWVRGQAYYLNNKRLSDKGQEIIEFGKKVAGPGPYGPKAPF